MQNFSGLSVSDVERQRKIYGFNEIKEKKPGIFSKFLKWTISPIALMLLVAALLSLLAGNLFDFYFILVLMFLNFFVSYWQESKADRAVEKLQEKLSVKVQVLRQGQWVSLPSGELVPKDLISLDIGDVIPTDSQILQSENLSVNESQLTGESLPKDKTVGEQLFSGSFLVTGHALATVTATGKNTSFGKTLLLVQNVRRRSILEEDILRISKFLSALSILAVVLLTLVLSYQHVQLFPMLLLDVSLVIAGIPISLPTVMSLIIGIGVLELAKKNSIVRQLSALEDLANVNLLLSDKTGTLTKNLISIQKIIAYNPDFSENQVMAFAATTANPSKSVINKAIIDKFAEVKNANSEQEEKIAEYEVLSVIPGDSSRKRSSAVVKTSNGEMCVSVGATQVVRELCNLTPELAKQFDSDIQKFAEQGYRSIAVALSQGPEEKNMRLLGLLLISDTVFEDAKGVISFLESNGIAVKVLTGDNSAISRRVAKELGLGAGVLSKQDLDKQNVMSEDVDWWNGKAVFSEILPEDKLMLVQAAKKYFRVAVTGDGVNDLPAIKTADVGIAVSNAVEALKSAADIVLLKPGISVIRDAVFEARRIFARLYSYSIYRISESLRLIVTIATLGLLYRLYPLTPVQLILLAFLNDLPIITLAFDRVDVASQPSSINVKRRFILSSLFGLTGITASLLMFYITYNVFHLSLPVIETLFFLKLTIGGHMLIYVAHTEKPWYKFLPDKSIIIATTLTQLLATLLALFGIFMSRAPILWIILIWVWAFAWMQVTELIKRIWIKFEKTY